MDLPDQLLTAQRVAEAYQVTPRTVWRWSEQGRIPRPVRPGRWLLSEIMRDIRTVKREEMQEAST